MAPKKVLSQVAILRLSFPNLLQACSDWDVPTDNGRLELQLRGDLAAAIHAHSAPWKHYSLVCSGLCVVPCSAARCNARLLHPPGLVGRGLHLLSNLQDQFLLTAGGFDCALLFA